MKFKASLRPEEHRINRRNSDGTWRTFGSTKTSRSWSRRTGYMIITVPCEAEAMRLPRGRFPDRCAQVGPEAQGQEELRPRPP